jgi:hypothetical protein
MPADLAKAIGAFGLAGGDVLGFETPSGASFFGSCRYAELDGEGVVPVSGISGRLPCIETKAVGLGRVYYIGTYAGSLWFKGGNPGLDKLIERVLESTGIGRRYPGIPDGVRVDAIKTSDLDCYVITNLTDEVKEVSTPEGGVMHGLFADREASTFALAPGQSDMLLRLFIKEENSREIQPCECSLIS